jgi:L-amino acid N-acyltransferase
MRVRDAVPGDAAAICALANALIDTTTVAWTEEHETVEARSDWLLRQEQAGHPVLVLEGDEVGSVLGFASYGDFRDSAKWPGYRFTVEHTVHVDGAHHGRGAGRLLMGELMARATSAGLHVMVGAIDADNAGSVAFHEALGFTEVARMPEVGFKFDRWLSLVLMQRRLVPEGHDSKVAPGPIG